MSEMHKFYVSIVGRDVKMQHFSLDWFVLLALSLHQPLFPPVHSPLCLRVMLPGFLQCKVLPQEGLNSPIIWF